MAAPFLSTSPSNNLSTSDSSPKPSQTAHEDPTSTLPRTRSTRSVQFFTPNTTTAMSRSASPGTSPHQQQQAESSADEITPIVSKEIGGAKKKNYDGTGKSTVNPDANTSRASSMSVARRRQVSSGSNGRQSSTVDEGKTHRGWGWHDWIEKMESVELENKGSVARDHLALERTFLAWLRTSLAFASIGIAITQLFRLNTTISERAGLSPTAPDSTYRLRQVGKPLGATFLGIAIVVLLAGSRRYFESQHWIIRGKFPASRGSIFLITFSALALIVTSLVIVVAVSPSVFEKK